MCPVDFARMNRNPHRTCLNCLRSLVVGIDTWQRASASAFVSDCYIWMSRGLNLSES